MAKSSKPQAIWVRVGMRIHPDNDIADDMLRSLPDGGHFVGSFRNVRSIRQLRLWWGLMNILVEHNIFPIKEAASHAVKIAAGHVDLVVFPDSGEVHMIPKSIAFESLPQHEFNVIFKAAIDAICGRWMRGTDSDELQREVWRALDGPGAIGERIR